MLSTDRDTLFPLQAALGYEITQSLFVGEHTLLVEGPSDLLYLRVFAEELRVRGRTSLDNRWTICPCEGIDKIGAFMALFGGNRLHVAVLADFASGQKKIEALRRSELLRGGHVLTFDTYTGQAEADVEDMLGPVRYVGLVNRCYGLKGSNVSTVPATPVGRIVKHAEDHVRMIPAVAEFNHFTPAADLAEHRTAVLKKAPEADVDEALARFDQAFKDLNALL